MQQLKTEVVIHIPETHVLIEKTEYEELQEQADEVWVSGMDWLVEQTSIGNKQTLREMLYAHREELEKFVHYPSGSKSRWMFNAHPTKQWLRENFHKVKK